MDRRPREPRSRDRQASTRALLEAAVEAFSAKGYDATTTKEIARQAGLNEQLISRYFGGKMGLLIAVYRDLLDRQEDDRAYEASTRKATVADEIRSFLFFKRRHLHATRKLMTIVIMRLLTQALDSETYDLSFASRTGNVLRERLKIFQEEGAISAEFDVGDVSDVIMFFVFTRSFIDPVITGVDENDTEENVESFVRLICGGLTPKSSAKV